jgi:hypothetical protein
MFTLGAGALFLRGPVHAQGPVQAPAQAPVQAPAQAPKVHYTAKTSFRMPVQIKDDVRAQLKEVCLFVKAGNADWVRQVTAPPTVNFFNYRVPHDGEYCFSVATIDKNGTMTPPDVSKEEPGLRVVVDTQAPVVELKTMAAPDGEICVMCNLQDEHPDHQSIKILYRGANNTEGVLEAHRAGAGLFRVPFADLWGSTVRVMAQDCAGNKVMRDLRMPLMNPTAVPAVSHQEVTQTGGSPYPAFPAPAKEAIVTVDPPPAPPAPLQSAPQVPSPQLPGPSAVHQPEPAKLPFRTEAPMTEIQPQKYVAPTAVSAAEGRQLLNSTHASLDYRIDKVGPSGIGKVEVWMTSDSGKNWQRLCEDVDRHSPAEIDLPGEGVYGIRLVVTNGNGFGGSPPKPGDTPTSWFEIDTTAPFVQMRDVDPVTDGGSLQIRWSASDKNLGANPVNLYYRTQQDAPWEVMAKELQNSGSYRWAFPHGRGSQFFVGIEVIDRAGNVMRAELPNPITLDMTEPSATVVSVSGVNARPR